MVRARLLASSFVGMVLLAAACGGKVVVDAEPAGSGGGGGAGTSSSSTGSGDAGPSLTCDFACGGPAGLCGCSGPCSDGKARGVGCGETKGGATCTCSVEGTVVGQCDQVKLTCALEASCCAAVFAK